MLHLMPEVSHYKLLHSILTLGSDKLCCFRFFHRQREVQFCASWTFWLTVARLVRMDHKNQSVTQVLRTRAVCQRDIL